MYFRYRLCILSVELWYFVIALFTWVILQEGAAAWILCISYHCCSFLCIFFFYCKQILNFPLEVLMIVLFCCYSSDMAENVGGGGLIWLISPLFHDSNHVTMHWEWTSSLCIKWSVHYMISQEINTGLHDVSYIHDGSVLIFCVSKTSF